MFSHLGECYLFLFLNFFNREPFSPFVYNRIIKRQETFDPKKVEREPYKGKDFFYLPYVSSIYEKATYPYVLDGKSASLGSCHFRVICLPHKDGASR